ncbi:MAG TPA: MutS family DNA mismatch repair protein [Polyangiaceae bacterium]|jgi:hypothetical protein|nr:MutS family DNA mismatch repair protein [Polyangiaceae bacterium]
MTSPDVYTFYRRGQEGHEKAAASLDKRSRKLAAARLILAGLAVVLLAGFAWGSVGQWLWPILGVVALVFAALVVVHAQTEKAKERERAAARFHKRGLSRVSLAWGELPIHAEPADASAHAFAADLDIFGRGSLMQLVDATETGLGQKRLGTLLSLEDPGRWPDEPAARQAAAQDLVNRVGFREALATAAALLSDERPNAEPMLSWAEGSSEAPSSLRMLLAWLVPALAITMGGFGAAIGLQSSVILLGFAALVAVGLLTGAPSAPMLDVVSAQQGSVTRWRASLAVIEDASFVAPLLVELHRRLDSSGRRASGQVAALERIVGFVDARRNGVFRLIIGPLLMWDVHCAFALSRWRVRFGRDLRTWLEALGEVEALASLGAFAFEHPDFAWPVFVREPMFDARALGHPLIGADRRVGNDIRLPPAGRALVVTGSNMSGKSTLLRAMGINAVLACAGGPVCAREMRIGPLRIATSMRVVDSLTDGVSHFYAELRRLKRILDLAMDRTRPPVLFLLDEILHGTNSRERVLGARAVVTQLLERGSLGAISTHDLGIAALAQEFEGRVENAHFSEQVTDDGTMTFDYVLRPGVVQSSNALRLMRAMGIAVPE